MKLPNLSELNLDNNSDKLKDIKKETEPPKKEGSKLPPVPGTLPEKDPVSASVKGETKKRRPKLPKSQYDEDGTPILTVPDLDDINLKGEIDRFFGEEDD